jgi:hypothetical protein
MSAIKTKTTRARTPAQQAIIDEMRKGASVEEATAKVLPPEPNESTEPTEPVIEHKEVGFMDVLAAIAPGKRAVFAFILGFIASATTGYMLGVLVNMLMTAVMVGSGSFMLSLLIFILGCVYAARVCGAIGTSVNAYFYEVNLETYYDDTKSKLTGWFDAAESLVTREEQAITEIATA